MGFITRAVITDAQCASLHNIYGYQPNEMLCIQAIRLFYLAENIPWPYHSWRRRIWTDLAIHWWKRGTVGWGWVLYALINGFHHMICDHFTFLTRRTGVKHYVWRRLARLHERIAGGWTAVNPPELCDLRLSTTFETRRKNYVKQVTDPIGVVIWSTAGDRGRSPLRENSGFSTKHRGRFSRVNNAP